MLCRIGEQDTVELISDGAVFQKNGESINVGKYKSIKARYAADIVATFRSELCSHS